jgi:hypothetical protein
MLPDLSVQIPLGGFVNSGEQVGLSTVKMVLGNNQPGIPYRRKQRNEELVENLFLQKETKAFAGGQERSLCFLRYLLFKSFSDASTL